MLGDRCDIATGGDHRIAVSQGCLRDKRSQAARRAGDEPDTLEVVSRDIDHDVSPTFGVKVKNNRRHEIHTSTRQLTS
jgi:hypothetical protein